LLFGAKIGIILIDETEIKKDYCLENPIEVEIKGFYLRNAPYSARTPQKHPVLAE
jgi:hypothetical protein